MSKRRHIASVVLNYNSTADVEALLPQLLLQQGVQHTVIVVDNASTITEEQRVRAVFTRFYPEGLSGTPTMVASSISAQRSEASAYLVLNHENCGYSAGNNIGIRLACALGADAVLIANPDMRIGNPSYLSSLSEAMFSEANNYIAASRIIGLDRSEQNPLREARFWEEVLWPVNYLKKMLVADTNTRLLFPAPATEIAFVPKVSGCCLLIRMSFLESINFLDENVFLYCEEPILAAQVRSKEGQIIFLPALSAVHAHKVNEKGDPVVRTRNFIESRKYYLRKYSGYRQWQIGMLDMSYRALLLFRKAIRLSFG